MGANVAPACTRPSRPRIATESKRSGFDPAASLDSSSATRLFEPGVGLPVASGLEVGAAVVPAAGVELQALIRRIATTTPTTLTTATTVARGIGYQPEASRRNTTSPNRAHAG